MKKQDPIVVWDESGHSLFERFAVQLRNYTHTGRLPKMGDQDIQYGLELQKERLKEKELLMKYEFTPRGHFADRNSVNRSWTDAHYVSSMECRTCAMTRTFYRDQKKVYDKKKNMLFYQIITNALDQKLVGEDLYTCPNCGAVSKVKMLQNGCKYCGTHFEMKDLFPKVTSYYFIEEIGGTENELKGSIKKFVLPCILISIVYLTGFYYFKNPDMAGDLITCLVSGLVGGTVFGGIVGYLLWAAKSIGKLFKEAGRSMPMLMNVSGSGKRFVAQMKRYSSEFSWEYFSDKVVSLVKMILFSKNPQELPNYVGKPLGNEFSDIVEASYTGAVALKNFRVQQGICYVAADVYMDDIHDKGNRLCDKRDLFRITLRKNIAKPINYHFSLKQIQCQGCGSSFDATKQKFCTNCGRRYEVGDEDWIVTDLRRLLN